MGRYLDLLHEEPVGQNPEERTATEATKPPLRSLLSLLSRPDYPTKQEFETEASAHLASDWVPPNPCENEIEAQPLIPVSVTTSAAATKATKATKAAPNTWPDVEEGCPSPIGCDTPIPSAWTAGFAKLNPDRPPVRVPMRRWQAVIKAIAEFLDCWAAEAVALGWDDPTDIFGADADRPEITWLNAGPLWFGDGARVVEVHADRTVVETKGGARQT